VFVQKGEHRHDQKEEEPEIKFGKNQRGTFTYVPRKDRAEARK